MNDVLRIAKERRRELAHEVQRIEWFLQSAATLAEQAPSISASMERAGQPNVDQASRQGAEATALAEIVRARNSRAGRNWYKRLARRFAAS